jgi:hypothetical protein
MSTVKKSSQQEEYVAEVLGAKKTPRSGATLHRKGDVQDSHIIVECKTYMEKRDSLTVKREWLTKLADERFQERKEFSILVQNFGGKPSEDNYVVMKLEDFAKMYEAYKEVVDG